MVSLYVVIFTYYNNTAERYHEIEKVIELQMKILNFLQVDFKSK